MSESDIYSLESNTSVFYFIKVSIFLYKFKKSQIYMQTI